MKNKKLKFLFIYLPLAVIMGCNTPRDTISTSGEHSHDADSDTVFFTTQQLKNLNILVGKLPVQTPENRISAAGLLEVPPQNRISISLPMGAYITETPILEGMHVKRGQRIFKVRHPDIIALQQEYLELKSAFVWAESENTRLHQLFKDSAVDARSVQMAKTDYDSDKARLRGVEAKIRMLGLSPEDISNNGISEVIDIPAPIDGFVSGMNVNIGAFAAPGQILCTLIDPEHLHAELRILEKDIAQVQVNDWIEVRLSGETVIRKATVYLIGRELNPDRTLTIHGHFDRDDPALTAGIFVQAEIYKPQTPVRIFPTEAILQINGTLWAYQAVLKEDGVVFTPVPLNTGEQVIERPIAAPEPWQTDTNVLFALKGAFRIKSALQNKDDGHGH